MRNLLRFMYQGVRRAAITALFHLSGRKWLVRQYWALRDFEEFAQDPRTYWEARGQSYLFEKGRAQLDAQGRYILDPRQMVLRDVFRECGVEPGSILDVGCNFGRNLRAFWEHFEVRDLTGFDFGLGSLAKAREYLGPFAGAQRVEAGLLCADATRSPFGDGTFDLVYTNGTLMCIPPEGVEAALQHLWRVSRRWVALQEIPFREGPHHWKGWDGSYRHDYASLCERLGLTVRVERLEDPAHGGGITYLLEKPGPCRFGPSDRRLFCPHCRESLPLLPLVLGTETSAPMQAPARCRECGRIWPVRDGMPVLIEEA